MQVINELISGVDQAERADLAVEAASIIADAIKSEDAVQTKTAFGGRPTISSKARATVLDIQQRGKSRLASIKSSYLYQIPLPDNLTPRTYGALYELLSRQGIIPLGILRGTFNSLTLGPLGNRLPYVYANPAKDVELFSCDRVFVLSVKPVGVNPSQGMQVEYSSLGCSSCGCCVLIERLLLLRLLLWL